MVRECLKRQAAYNDVVDPKRPSRELNRSQS